MAEVNIRLTYNRQTGKNDIFIDYESDRDSLPFEHEETHKELVERIISAAGLSEDDFGEVIVRRLSHQEKALVLSGEELPALENNTNKSSS